MKSVQRIKPVLSNRDKQESFTPIATRKTPLQTPQLSITLRRHSIVNSNHCNDNNALSLNHRVSSKQLKSLQKYVTANRADSRERVIKEKLRVVKSGLASDKGFLSHKCYKYLNMVGKGGFGKVWKVQHQTSLKFYAMKQISKAIAITKRSVQSIINERQFLAVLRHPFIVPMIYAFQDEQNLYIVMNLMQGGDLRYHLSKKVVFHELQTKFMVAGVILALEYLHSRMIIHRDVKPQNIVFDRRGYAYLTDLGIAKNYRVNNSEDTSGTPGYMAPQVMFHHNHRFQVDCYAIGVIIYEIMMGIRPYMGKSRQEIKQKVKEKQVIITKKEIPEGWTMEAADFVNKLLQRKPIQRLGWAGIEEVKEHPWLKQFPWDDLLSGTLESPVKRYYNYQQVRYKQTENDTTYVKLLEKNKQMLTKGAMQQYFQGYTYEDNTSTAENTKGY